MRSILRAQKNVAERKSHKGRKPDWDFSEPKMPVQGILQLPFAMRRGVISINFYF
jgi:hypothetical protein